MISRARHLAAAALCGALLMLPAFAGTAAAAPSHVEFVPLAKTAEDVKKVAEYWKPDKLKQADSYSPATPGAQAAPTASTNAGAAAGPAAPATGRVVPAVMPAAPATGLAAAAVAPAALKRGAKATWAADPEMPRKGKVGVTMGKVFFRFGQKEYWCSASSVAAKNHSVVATAGHCVYDPRQAKPAEYWIFVPNPGPNGETPKGIYVGSSISMHQDWFAKGDYDYDYAFVTVHRGFTWTLKNGQYAMQDVGRLQDNAGGLGLELNRRPGTYTVAAFGYPAGAQPDGSRPYNGTKLRMCREGPTRWTVAPSLDLQKGVQLQACDFSPGASGGPWVIGWNKERWIGSLNGVNSLTWNRDAKGMYDAVSSPYFDSSAGDVYRRAATQPIPANVT